MPDAMLVLGIGGSNLDQEVFRVALQACLRLDSRANSLLPEAVKPTLVMVIRKDRADWLDMLLEKKLHSSTSEAIELACRFRAHNCLEVLGRHGARWRDYPYLASTIAQSGDVGLMSQYVEQSRSLEFLSCAVASAARYGHLHMCVWLSRRVCVHRGSIAAGLDFNSETGLDLVKWTFAQRSSPVRVTAEMILKAAKSKNRPVCLYLKKKYEGGGFHASLVRSAAECGLESLQLFVDCANVELELLNLSELSGYLAADVIEYLIDGGVKVAPHTLFIVLEQASINGRISDKLSVIQKILRRDRAQASAAFFHKESSSWLTPIGILAWMRPALNSWTRKPCNNLDACFKIKYDRAEHRPDKEPPNMWTMLEANWTEIQSVEEARNLLVKYRADPGQWFPSDALLHTLTVSVSCLGFLIENRANPNRSCPEQSSPLIEYSLKTSGTEHLEVFLAHGAVIQSRRIPSALVLNVELGELDAVDFLLDARADIDFLCSFYDCEGFAPLHVAVQSDRRLIFSSLIGRGAKVDIGTKKTGLTPLMMSCVVDEGLRYADWLIERNADPNARDRCGRTALFYAAMAANVGIARHLIEHKANARIADKRGIRPIDMAHFCSLFHDEYGLTFSVGGINCRAPARHAQIVAMLKLHTGDTPRQIASDCTEFSDHYKLETIRGMQP